jgi:hypothetical protein
MNCFKFVIYSEVFFVLYSFSDIFYLYYKEFKNYFFNGDFFFLPLYYTILSKNYY